MQVVSFQTAKRLKEAGFPQPETYDTFDWYYSKTGFLANHFDSACVIESDIFAPSATDILKELGRGWHLCYKKESRSWECWYQTVGGASDKYHENPAEACAAAWLAKNEKV